MDVYYLLILMLTFYFYYNQSNFKRNCKLNNYFFKFWIIKNLQKNSFRIKHILAYSSRVWQKAQKNKQKIVQTKAVSKENCPGGKRFVLS